MFARCDVIGGVQNVLMGLIDSHLRSPFLVHVLCPQLHVCLDLPALIDRFAILRARRVGRLGDLSCLRFGVSGLAFQDRGQTERELRDMTPLGRAATARVVLSRSLAPFPLGAFLDKAGFGWFLGDVMADGLREGALSVCLSSFGRGKRDRSRLKDSGMVSTGDGG